MEEVWKNIEGYEGYQVSNLGRVKSLKWGKERIMKLKKHKYGYLVAGLFKKGKQNFYLVHRLVAQAFIPNPNGFSIINHKDENTSNNNVDNLEWCNQKYNTNYGTAQQRRTDKMINGKLSKTVYQYSLDGEFIKEWPSTQEVQRQLGYYNTYIGKCCLGKFKQAYGYIWKYEKMDHPF